MIRQIPMLILMFFVIALGVSLEVFLTALEHLFTVPNDDQLLAENLKNANNT